MTHRSRPLGLLLLLLVLALTLAACAKPTPPSAPAAAAPSATSSAKDPATARARIAAGAVVIDVRTPDEYAQGHLENATNLPVDELPARLGEVDGLVAGDKARPIVVYCATGGRAAQARTQLEAAGYKNIVNGGGYEDLR
jgi:phage shock protein E